MDFLSLSFRQKSPRGRVLFRSNNTTNTNGGVTNANALNTTTNSNANYGSPFETTIRAENFGKGKTKYIFT